jgi:glycosyltransferase involved in cell wall biosynthesis
VQNHELANLDCWCDLLRVAQVCPSYQPFVGGVQTHVREISMRLARRGFDIEILTTDPTRRLPPEESSDGLLIKRFAAWAPDQAYYFSPALRRYLNANIANYDLIHAHNYHALPALYAARAKGGKRFVFTPRYHGAGHTFFRNLLHFPYRYLARNIFGRSDKVICLSNHEKELVLARFHLPEEKLTLIPNGINKSEFANINKQRKAGAASVLCVSRLEKYKGVDELIRVVPKLPEDVTVEIIGQGPYETRLVKLLHELGLQSRITINSNLARNDLLRRYAEANVLVLLSRYEAFGNTVAEALASGTHCVLANTSALSDWIDNENCFGVDYPIDRNHLTYSLNYAIDKSKEGRAKVDLLDWDDVAEKVSTVYLG